MVLIGLYVPVRVCFIDTDPLGLVIFDYMFDFVFWIDLFLSFVSAFINDEGEMVDSHKKIAEKYLSGWFLIDFVAVFPIKEVMAALEKANPKPQKSSGGLGNSSKLLRLLRLLRLYRLLRLLKLGKGNQDIKKEVKMARFMG